MIKLKKMRNFKGFTLIELIVVIAIISVLALTAIAALNPFAQFQKGNDARIKSDLAQVQKGLETYYQDKGRYPTKSVDYKIVDPNLGTISWGGTWQPYMNIVPKDPTSTHNYIYNVSADGQTYYLYANLLRGVKDPQSCSGGTACPNVPSGVTCGSGSACNFGVTSPNVTP